MYSLRVYQQKKNTHLKLFDKDNTVTITLEDFKTLDWATCVFQVYPADYKTHSFYSNIPAGHSLCLYDVKTGKLMGETEFADQYIYFKPESPSEVCVLKLSLVSSPPPLGGWGLNNPLDLK